MTKKQNSPINYIIIFIFPFILFCVLFTSCKREDKTILSNGALNENIVSNANQDKFDVTVKTETKNKTYSIDRSTEIKQVINAEKIVSSWEEYNSEKFPLIASIPERDIYLYGLKSQGVILYINGDGHYYDWEYLTPRFILPMMAIFDYDNDGKEELAVSLYVGSGTGYSVTDLHIIEIFEDKILSNNTSCEDSCQLNPNYFKDYFYSSTDYIAQLGNDIIFDIQEKDNEKTGKIEMGNKSYQVNLSQYYTVESGKIIEKLNFGNIIYFDFSDSKIKAKFGVGIGCENFASPFFIGDICADVKYENGLFKLDNYEFIEDIE